MPLAPFRLHNVVFPPVCPVCLRHAPDREWRVCSGCLSQLKRVLPPHCQGCGGVIDGVLQVCSECLETERPWRRAVTVFEFGGIARRAIHRFKYGGEMALTRFFAAHAHQAWETGLGFAVDIAVPVPMHWMRQCRRGYNQSELLASEWSHLTGIRCCRALVRRRRTLPQSSLNLADRRRNLKGAFYVKNGFSFTNSKVLLVDDVFTTGATLEACTLALLEAGAECVDVLTVARG